MSCRLCPPQNDDEHFLSLSHRAAVSGHLWVHWLWHQFNDPSSCEMMKSRRNTLKSECELMNIRPEHSLNIFNRLCVTLWMITTLKMHLIQWFVHLIESSIYRSQKMIMASHCCRSSEFCFNFRLCLHFTSTCITRITAWDSRHKVSTVIPVSC